MWEIKRITDKDFKRERPSDLNRFNNPYSMQITPNKDQLNKQLFDDFVLEWRKRSNVEFQEFPVFGLLRDLIIQRA